jgi:hypothetical protein
MGVKHDVSGGFEEDDSGELITQVPVHRYVLPVSTCHLCRELTIFSEGTAIYLNCVIGPAAGVFQASIDGQAVEVDGFSKSTTTDCALSWSSWGLNRSLHTVEIEYIGASKSATSASSSSFDFSNFVYVNTRIV